VTEKRPADRLLERAKRDPELESEMGFHLATIEEELRAEGWSAADAEVEARRRFGDPEAVRAAVDEVDGRTGMSGIRRWTDAVRQDLSFALRQMVRRPAASVMALLTLVLGVSATALVFSVVHAVVLQGLPFEDPDRLVGVSQTSPQGRLYSISEPNYVDFRERQEVFTEMGARGFARVVLTEEGRSESLGGLRATNTFLRLLGIDPVLGRHFTAAEDAHEGAEPVVLLAHGFWERHFGADQAVLDRAITIDGIRHRVVGVVPLERSWPEVEVVLPLGPHPTAERDNQMIEAVGRLAPGVTLTEAEAEMSRIAADLSAQYPESHDGWGADVRLLREFWVGPRLTRIGGFLLGAVGLLLLMVCVSITNLRVAQASVRLREMGVRIALGAGRGRITSQVLVEGLILAVVGGSLAVGLTYWALPLLKALGPVDMVRLAEASVNLPVLVVSLTAALLAVVVSGVAPVLLYARQGHGRALRMGSGQAGDEGGRLRNALVVGQFALAVTVVLGAGLMTRSLIELQRVELGFEPEGMARFSVRLPDTRFQRAERTPYVRRLVEEVEAVPGVIAAGASHARSLWGPPLNFVAPSDREPDRQEDFQPVTWRGVVGHYFEATGTRLLAGRTFGPADQDPDAAPTIMVDRALAEALWPGGDPVGETLTWFIPGGLQLTVIGVVENVRDEVIDAEARPRVYVPYEFTSWFEPSILVRTSGDPEGLLGALADAALQVDPTVPAMSLTTLQRDLRRETAWPRFNALVLAAFSAAALLLAALGIYGLTAFTVSRRRREIGVRVALGANRSGVMQVVLRRSLVLAGLGIALGVVASLGLARLVEGLVYGVSPQDPVTFGVVVTVMVVLAVISAAVPARRALAVSPREALRED